MICWNNTIYDTWGEKYLRQKKKTRQKHLEKTEIRADYSKKVLSSFLEINWSIIFWWTAIWWLLIGSEYISQLLFLWSILIGTRILVVWDFLYIPQTCITVRKMIIFDNKIFVLFLGVKFCFPSRNNCTHARVLSLSNFNIF